MKYFLCQGVNPKLALFNQTEVFSDWVVDNAQDFNVNFIVLGECNQEGELLSHAKTEAPAPIITPPVMIGKEATEPATITEPEQTLSDPEPTGVDKRSKVYKEWKERQQKVTN